MSDTPILEFDSVRIAMSASNDTAWMQDISLAVQPGETVLIAIPRNMESAPFCDVAQGLTPPAAGAVQCMGRPWTALSIHEASAMRARIGRVFEQNGWVSNLSMYENIALVARHYSDRPDADIRADILALCERIELRDLLSERPHLPRRSELRKAQWVRAFLGHRDLVLLESPLNDLRADSSGPLFDLIGDMTRAGGAVILLSTDLSLYQAHRDRIPAARGFELVDGELKPLQGGTS